MVEIVVEYMNVYNSRTYMDDLDYVISECGWLERFKGKRILITGATGLICSSVADLLFRYNELNDAGIVVYVAGRNKERAQSRFVKYKSASCFSYIEYDACKSNIFNGNVDYIIHGASNAYPKAVWNHPIDTMKANFLGMLELLEYAVEQSVSNTVFISSSEIYGKKESLKPFTEDEYGFIDILNSRSSYAVGKRATETLCVSFTYEKKLPVSIIRPGHIYGPTACRNDNRVSSAFAYDVVEGKDLVLKSDGSQIRSYCYMLDCATAILKVLLDGKAATAYNVSNMHSLLSIKELAVLYAEYGGVRLKFEKPAEIEKKAFNPMQNSSLNGDRLLKLGWRGLFNSQKGVEHTIRVLKEAL